MASELVAANLEAEFGFDCEFESEFVAKLTVAVCSLMDLQTVAAKKY